MPADLPSGYSAGNVTVPANTAVNLFTLIQSGVDNQSSGSATVLNITADAANTGPVYIGANTKVSATIYGRSLAAGAQANYGSGSQSAIQVGRMYVFSAAAAVLHIELFP